MSAVRILRLRGGHPRPWDIELHPRLTVVHGLPPEVAGPVREAIDALLHARTSGPELAAAGLGGWIRIGTDELALADASDRLAGLVPARPLAGADLAHPEPSPAAARHAVRARLLADAEARQAAAAAELAEARQAWHDVQAARAARLRTAWHDRAEAATALGAARRQVVAAAVGAVDTGRPAPLPADPNLTALARRRLDAARAAHRAAAAALDEARALEAELLAGPAVAPGDLAELRANLADAEAAVARGPAPVPAPHLDREALVARRAALRDAAADLAPRSTERVASTLAAVDAHGGIAAVEAARVAVEWERVRDLMAEAPPAPEPPTTQGAGASGLFSRPAPSRAGSVPPALVSRVAVAVEKVERARRTVAEASGASPLDPRQVEALEAAHAEVLAAWEGSERRIGVGKARRRLEEAQLAEREILAQMGFASYTEFMVSGRASGLPSAMEMEEARRALVKAEAELADAEAALRVAEEEAVSSLGPEPAPAPGPEWTAAGGPGGRLTATLDALRARAAELLGHDPGEDVAATLRDRIATDPLPDLRLALDDVGVPLNEVLTRDEVLSRARMWIARQEEAAGRIAELGAERLMVEDELARIDAADGTRAAHEAVIRRRDELRAALAAAEEAVAVDDVVAERVEQDRAALARAEADVAEAERTLADIEAGAVNRAVGAPRSAGVRPTGPVVSEAEAAADARDAQTALDAAVSHLLPTGPVGGDEAARALGRAEARVAVARLERDALLAAAAGRGGAGEDVPGAVAAEVVVWRILARLASHRQVAVAGGPGATPLLLLEPFAALAAEDLVPSCTALVGPASAVQVVLLTDRPEIATWAAGCDPAEVGLVSAVALAGGARG